MMNRRYLRWMVCAIVLILWGGLFIERRTHSVRSAPLQYDPFSEEAVAFSERVELPTAVRLASEPTFAVQGAQGWEVVSQQTFPTQSAWGGWSVLPESGHGWGIEPIDPGINFGAWVDGAMQDVTFNTGETYVNDMETWLVFGPIANSEDIWELRVAFNYFIQIKEGDYFKVAYSTDGEYFQGLEITSLQMVAPAWASATVPFNVGRGNSQLWLGFGFTSDASDVAQGVWLDDITLLANYGTRLALPLVYKNWAPERPGFFDDFSDPASGWPQRVYNRPGSDGDFMWVGYRDATYRMKVLLNYDGANNRKMGAVRAPYDNDYTNYDVSVDHYFARASDQVVTPKDGKGGLIFAANDAFSTAYVFEWNFQGNCAVTRFDDLSLPVSELGGDLDETPIMGWRACGTYGLIGDAYGADDTNHLLVEVRGNRARIYVVNDGNKRKVTEFTADFLKTHHNVGLLTGAFDLTPVESRFDNFEVVPVD